MQTPKEREEDFVKEFRAFLDKHGARIEADGNTRDFGNLRCFTRIHLSGNDTKPWCSFVWENQR